VAVLSDKSATKETSQGKKYGVWTLSDLDGNELRLFVFGDAFAEHWKESESAVLAVLSAQVRAAEGGGLSLSVDKPGQLFKLASSADFGLCRGERKDGRRCTMALNVRLCEYCPFHASAALKSLRSGRLELSTGGCASRHRRAPPALTRAATWPSRCGGSRRWPAAAAAAAPPPTLCRCARPRRPRAPALRRRAPRPSRPASPRPARGSCRAWPGGCSRRRRRREWAGRSARQRSRRRARRSCCACTAARRGRWWRPRPRRGRRRRTSGRRRAGR